MAVVGIGFTVNAVEETTLLAEVVTTIFPVWGVASVVTTICVAIFETIVQASPFNVTEVASLKFVPVIVIVIAAFEQAVLGVNDVITGPGAACVKYPK